MLVRYEPLLQGNTSDRSRLASDIRISLLRDDMPERIKAFAIAEGDYVSLPRLLVDRSLSLSFAVQREEADAVCRSRFAVPLTLILC